jgi:hypothetical protein
MKTVLPWIKYAGVRAILKSLLKLTNVKSKWVAITCEYDSKNRQMKARFIAARIVTPFLGKKTERETKFV